MAGSIGFFSAWPRSLWVFSLFGSFSLLTKVKTPSKCPLPYLDDRLRGLQKNTMKTKGKLVDLVRSKTYTSSAGPLRMAAAVGRKIRDHRRLDTEEKGAKPKKRRGDSRENVPPHRRDRFVVVAKAGAAGRRLLSNRSTSTASYRLSRSWPGPPFSFRRRQCAVRIVFPRRIHRNQQSQ